LSKVESSSDLIGFICFQVDRMRYRRRRTAFTEEQLARLEESFLEEKFPGITMREKLAEELKLKEDRIQVIQVDCRLTRKTRKAISGTREEHLNTCVPKVLSVTVPVV